MARRMFVIVAGMCLLASACANSSSTAGANGSTTTSGTDQNGSATISGTVKEAGGPNPGNNTGVVSDVTVSGDDRVSLKSASDGTFHATVNAGSYEITAHLSGGHPCDTQKVTAKAGATVSVTVTCSVK